MTKYRVECNFGSKYFDCAVKAFGYFSKCKAKNRDVELWLVSYGYNKIIKRYAAAQELLDYSNTNFPKH